MDLPRRQAGGAIGAAENRAGVRDLRRHATDRPVALCSLRDAAAEIDAAAGAEGQGEVAGKGSEPGDEQRKRFHGERIAYAVLAVAVGVIATAGALSLTDSRSVEEAPPAEATS